MQFRSSECRFSPSWRNLAMEVGGDVSKDGESYGRPEMP